MNNVNGEKMGVADTAAGSLGVGLGCLCMIGFQILIFGPLIALVVWIFRSIF